MRILMRMALVLVALGIAAVAALAVTLPRLIQSEAVRARIGEAARDATGREVAYGELDVGVLPPRLLVTQARVAGSTPKAEPMLEGAQVELRLSLLPLLLRAVVVDSLVIEGATLRLVRTAQGIELPKPKTEAKPAAQAKPAPGATAEPTDSGGAMALAVRSVRVRQTRVILEDRTVSPATTWDAREVTADVKGDSLDDPIDLDVSASLASGGRLRLRGRAQQKGPFALELELDGVALGPAAPYLPKGQRVAGTVTGSVAVNGKDFEPSGVAMDLRLADSELSFDDLALRGPVAVRADVKGGLERPEGTFSIDATAASLRYGETFEKAPGMPATAEGRIVTTKDGNIGIDNTRVRIRNLDARAAVETGQRTRLRLDAEPFALEGWEKLLPALAETPLAGRIGFEALDLTVEPQTVRGRITLDGVQLQSAKGEHLLLRGAILGEGNTIRDDNLMAEVAGQSTPLSLRITDLARTPRVTLRTKLQGADSNQLMTVFAKKPDTLSGPLNVDVDVAMPLAGDRKATDVLTGTVSFSIRPGRLKGVSLLRSAFERFGSAGEIAILAGRLKGGKTLQRFYGDDFEVMEGTLRLGGGRVRTDDLRAVYRNYTVDLQGDVKLADLALDMRGQLSIGEEIDAVLAGDENAEQQPASLAESARKPGKKRVLPLAKVGGTLDAPKVVLDAAVVRSFALQYALDSKSDKLDKYKSRADEILGEGTGDKVLDALGGLLGGGGRR